MFGVAWGIIQEKQNLEENLYFVAVFSNVGITQYKNKPSNNSMVIYDLLFDR